MRNDIKIEDLHVGQKVYYNNNPFKITCIYTKSDDSYEPCLELDHTIDVFLSEISLRFLKKTKMTKEKLPMD